MLSYQRSNFLKGENIVRSFHICPINYKQTFEGEKYDKSSKFDLYSTFHTVHNGNSVLHISKKQIDQCYKVKSTKIKST